MYTPTFTIETYKYRRVAVTKNKLFKTCTYYRPSAYRFVCNTSLRLEDENELCSQNKLRYRNMYMGTI